METGQKKDKNKKGRTFKSSAHQLLRSRASSVAASNISINEGWTNAVTRGIPSGYLD